MRAGWSWSQVAEALGNTPAISRKSYVHPKLIEAARDNPKAPLGEFARPRTRKWMSTGEVALLAYLLKGKRKKAPADPFGADFEEHALRIVASQVTRIEQEIDAMNADLPPLTSFILPSGSAAVASLHLARAIVRRAERSTVALAASEDVSNAALAYLNRLSDHLFVAARWLAAAEGGDVLWQPGATRNS